MRQTSRKRWTAASGAARQLCAGSPKSGDFGYAPRNKKGRGASLRRRTTTSILKRIRSRLNPSSRHAG